MHRSLVRTFALTVCLSSLLASGYAQAPATPATGAPSSSTAPKVLGSADRKFIKDAAEQVLAVTRITELTRHKSPGGDDVKKLNAKILQDYNKIWGDIGTFAQAQKVDLPKTEASPNEKQQIDKIRKTDAAKFDKTLLKALDKETRKAAQIFEEADKSVQDADLKTIVANWRPKVKGYADEVTAAEAEAAKKK